MGIDRNGLVAHYQHFTTDGQLLDLSGKGNHGTINGATPTADHNGRTNRAFNTTMQSQYISIANVASLNLQRETTIIWGGKIGEATAFYSPFINKYQDNNNYFTIQQWYNASPTRIVLDSVVGGGTALGIYCDENTGYNNEQHYAFVISASGNKIYINGVSKNLVANIDNNIFGTNSGNLRLGAYPNFGTDTKTVNHNLFAMYNRALSASEIQKLYNYWRTH